MACQLQVIAAHPLVANHLVQVLLKDRQLRGLLARPAVLDLDSLPLRCTPRLFIVDNHFLPFELSKLMRLLRVRCRRARFLVFIPQSRDEETEMLRLLHLGIEGVLTFSGKVESEMLTAVRVILGGGVWVASSVVRRYQSQLDLLHSGHSDSDFSLASLTGREKQVFALLVRRFSNKEIADALRISERTVKFHVSNIFLKVGVRRRSGLVGFLLEHPIGLVPLDERVLVAQTRG